jgi:hypothetical protein
MGEPMSDAPEQGLQQTADQPTEPDTGVEKDWQAEAEKWKSLARKHEGNARTNADAAKRLAAIEEQNKTELERAVDKASQEARTQYATVANARLIRSEVKAAAAALGFHDPADAAVQLRDAFGDITVSEDGDVDEKAVKALIEKLASEKPYLVKSDSGKPLPLPGQGQHQTPTPSGRERGLAEARKRFGDKKPA